MKFGIVYPNYGEFCSTPLLRDIAEVADSYYTFLLTWDHMLYTHGNQTLDAFSILSYLAGITKRVKLGTCVTPLPLRGPVNVAKLVSSLDIISEGRAILGVGAGWYRKEFELFGAWTGAKERVMATKDGITKISSLLSKAVSGRGNVTHFKCVQKPRPPIWVGTKRPAMIKVAATIADGWIPSNIEPVDYARIADYILSTRRGTKADRQFDFGYHMSGLKSSSSYVRKIDELEKAGCQFIAVYPGGQRTNYLESLGKLTKDVIPSFA